MKCSRPWPLRPKSQTCGRLWSWRDCWTVDNLNAKSKWREGEMTGNVNEIVFRRKSVLTQTRLISNVFKQNVERLKKLNAYETAAFLLHNLEKEGKHILFQEKAIWKKSKSIDRSINQGYQTFDYSLEHTAIILISPDKNFGNSTQRFDQQISILFVDSLIFVEHIVKVPVVQKGGKRWIEHQSEIDKKDEKIDLLQMFQRVHLFGLGTAPRKPAFALEHFVTTTIWARRGQHLAASLGGTKTIEIWGKKIKKEKIN